MKSKNNAYLSPYSLTLETGAMHLLRFSCSSRAATANQMHFHFADEDTELESRADSEQRP